MSSAAVNADGVLVVVDTCKVPQKWYEKFTNVDEVIPISAKYGQGVDDIKERVLSKLPLGPAYYPKVNVVITSPGLPQKTTQVLRSLLKRRHKR